MRNVLVLVTLLAGCPGDPVECGSTQGFLSGDVTVGAQVFARPTAGGDTVTGEVTSDTYELNLEGDTEWTVWAQLDDCFSRDITVSVDACEEYTEDLVVDINECETADKPNLYLYPTSDTPTSVVIEADPRQRIFESMPAYNDGWHGVAHPDGTFTSDGERAPFLFYEITLLPKHRDLMQRDQGYCVAGEGAVQTMADILGQYGFNGRERRDFVDGWRDDLPIAASYTVYPQLHVDPMATLHIEPALPVHRLWLRVEDGAQCQATPPIVVPFDRSDAHGVEWGVVLGM
ncbi:MAG: hypothetical protein ACI9MC_004261 [Kiritimatiellia bacterium]|jgi:hypothetical protein